jgi:hypothetical protein
VVVKSGGENFFEKFRDGGGEANWAVVGGVAVVFFGFRE